MDGWTVAETLRSTAITGAHPDVSASALEAHGTRWRSRSRWLSDETIDIPRLLELIASSQDRMAI